jgi:hypothetical protein
LFGGSVDPDASAGLRVTTVRRDGRWFVSPVGTLLDVVDAAAAELDREQLLAGLGLYEDLSVEGVATLGVPVTGTSDHPMSVHVYNFDATAGQRIVGTFSTAEPTRADDDGYVNAVVVRPDSTETYDSYNLFQGPGLTLADSGPYRLVLWVPATGSFSFTLYDAQDAPAELLDREGGYAAYHLRRAVTRSP